MKKATLGQASYVLDLLREKDVSLERLQQLIDSGLLADLLDADPTKIDRTKFRSVLEHTDNMPTYTVTVNYDYDLARMIAAVQDDDHTSQYFPRCKKRGLSEIELVLVHLDRNATTQVVEAELDKRGLRAATIEELLALSAAHPRLQWQFPIVALGSICVIFGAERVPVLYEHYDHGLCLGYSGSGWRSYYRFLAVRKPACPACR